MVRQIAVRKGLPNVHANNFLLRVVVHLENPIDAVPRRSSLEFYPHHTVLVSILMANAATQHRSRRRGIVLPLFSIFSSPLVTKSKDATRNKLFKKIERIPTTRFNYLPRLMERFRASSIYYREWIAVTTFRGYLRRNQRPWKNLAL